MTPRLIPAAALLCALAACGRSNQPAETTPAATPAPAAAPAAPPAVGVYVTNEGDDNLVVVDVLTHAVTKTLSLGKAPRKIVVQP